MRNFQNFSNYFFIVPALIKWFQKVLAMKKMFNQLLKFLKQPKKVKNAIYGSSKPFFSILTQLFVFQIKGVSDRAIEFLTSRYERKH